jgi:putative peptidoglycan lipid II flippase
MIRAFLSVGFWTLLSRITGFLRDILLAGSLGAGQMMDAFTVAFRLPNHFRAIFGEGAFENAFVPALTRIRAQLGAEAAALFQGRILALVLGSQGLLLVLVLIFTPEAVRLLAPGFAARPDLFGLATELTRITFPYLALVTLMVLWKGVLNAEKRFVAGAAAPILLNAAMIGALLAGGLFPSLAHAAAWGVLAAGILEAGLLAFAAARAGLLAPPRLPRPDPELARFFRAFVPAVIGAAGVQIAMFMDTIIVTFLPQGGASALYYADRLYQLPIGVIGIAAGTVIVPEMSRLLAENRPEAAHAAQNRALVLGWLAAAPFLVGFLVLPHLIVQAFFERGAFDAAASQATAGVLAAYALGLPAAIAIRSAVASFTARGDTATPLLASLSGLALNLVLKLLLWREHGAAGLALATSLGALVNLAILAGLAIRQGKAAPDALLGRALAVILIAGSALAAAFAALAAPLAGLPPIARLAALGLCGGLLYAGIVALGLRLARIPLTLRRPPAG